MDLEHGDKLRARRHRGQCASPIFGDGGWIVAAAQPHV
jgi:hypothetical protein